MTIERRRSKGTGSVLRRPDSEFLWIKYSYHGMLYRESAETSDERKAEKILQQRLAELKTGTFIPPNTQRVRIAELADDLLREYRVNSRKSTDDAVARWNLHLKPFFGHLRANALTTELVTRYIDLRQREGAKNATINRELALLKRMLRLAYQATPQKVVRLIRIPKLRENNIRKGFVNDEQFDILRSYANALWYQTLLVLGRTYGWRVGELLQLRVSQVDLKRRTLRLEPGTTKNNDGREVTLTNEAHELLVKCAHNKSANDFLLTRPCGKPVLDFRGTWQAACVHAGLGRLTCTNCKTPMKGHSKCPHCKQKQLHYEGLLFHDLRRTAARRMRAAGIHEGLVMAVGGWKTRSVFERYAIITNQDIADAMTKLEQTDRSRMSHVHPESTNLQTKQSSATLDSSTV